MDTYTTVLWPVTCHPATELTSIEDDTSAKPDEWRECTVGRSNPFVDMHDAKACTPFVRSRAEIGTQYKLVRIPSIVVESPVHQESGS